MWLSHLGEAEAREVRIAEVEHPRPEGEAPVSEVHIAELDQGEQEAARGRACEAGGARHVAERELAVLGVESADYRQAPFEGLDEI